MPRGDEYRDWGAWASAQAANQQGRAERVGQPRGRASHCATPCVALRFRREGMLSMLDGTGATTVLATAPRGRCIFFSMATAFANASLATDIADAVDADPSPSPSRRSPSHSRQ